jgi:hypothetical protein
MGLVGESPVERISTEERIDLGIDEAWQQRIRADYMPLLAIPEYFSADDKAMVQEVAADPQAYIDKSVGLATALRAGVLAEPYVEESEVFEAIWGDKVVTPKERRMHVGRQLGTRALAYEDHGTLLFPKFQFEDGRGYSSPFDVITAVKMIMGKKREWTSWSDVLFWLSPTSHLPIPGGTSAKAPKDLIADPSKHMAIVTAAMYMML